jgi:hypothetical protein
MPYTLFNENMWLYCPGGLETHLAMTLTQSIWQFLSLLDSWVSGARMFSQLFLGRSLLGPEGG